MTDFIACRVTSIMQFDCFLGKITLDNIFCGSNKAVLGKLLTCQCSIYFEYAPRRTGYARLGGALHLLMKCADICILLSMVMAPRVHVHCPQSASLDNLHLEFQSSTEVESSLEIGS